ncbi:tol-pal system-associated acyl-CoA thioesterase [Natronospira bacteriovora]|uniref:Tol-pal system-associated acyl-CoA thioesterase n=1 Tax=Natronospira bacteriovora TaxID=3069753 RepID=A0ABU0W3I5_9GAMM|nr:tol-pal system-associated acyl-CoA thioesterase [Natronospira sp. AB-CW4]MDQ2068511.1 tol-pal system-associated acyl-CoA thioesterase [Natronospira sp. AB-CW4]
MTDTFEWPVRVYYEDTDVGGVVFYANYLKFMERARTEWLRSRGFEQDVLIREQGVLFAVASAEIRYRAPARFNDLLHVTARVTDKGRSRMSFEQTVYRPADDRHLTDGLIRVACLDAETFRPRPIPEEMQRILFQ